MEGVDYSFDPPSPAALKAAGKTFAMVYVGPGSEGKQVDSWERDQLWANGIAICLLAEGTEQGALGGTSVGVQHARTVQADLEELKVPSSIPIYFAVDFNATATQWPAVASYFRGAASVLGPARIGLYGGYWQVSWGVRDNIAAYFFQTYAWSTINGALTWHPAAHVQQYKNNVLIGTGSADLCRSMKPNFGQWVKGGSSVTQPSYVELGHQWDGAYLIKRIESLCRMDPEYTVTKPDGSKATEVNDLVVALNTLLAKVNAPMTGGLTEAQIRTIVREELNKTKLTS
jgi:hypothetical protein